MLVNLNLPKYDFKLKRIEGSEYIFDEVRKKYDDWDFSEDGRIRQSERMSNLADSYLKTYKYCVSDFVCPTTDTLKIFLV